MIISDNDVAEVLTGRQFQVILREQGVKYHQRGLCHVTECGVSAVRNKDEWMVIPSLPDFEGVLPGGRQFIFDAKVCSQASFCLAKYREDTRGARSRQLRHMYNRSRYGVPCFFAMHWNQRQLKKSVIPAETWLFPVAEQHEFWKLFQAGSVKSITREDCHAHGTPLRWTCGERERKPRPDFLAAINEYLQSAAQDEMCGVAASCD